MIDISIYESGDGGELQIMNNDLQTVNGLTNQVYLALFGGNTEQSTTADVDELERRLDWWGNLLLSEEFQFNSSFEKMLQYVVLNSNGLKQLREAAKKDLKYLEKYAEIEVEMNVTGLNRLQVLVTITQPNNFSTKLQYIWDGTKNTLIEQRIL